MCDTIAALDSATLSGSVLFGKNSDRQPTEAQHLELIPAARHPRGEYLRLTYKEIPQVADTYTVLLSKPHWIWGAEIGANEHGLTIGNEALFSKIPPSLEKGVIGMDYVRLALERAQSVDEGITVITTLLREYGQSGNCGFERELAYHNSFLLADTQGAKVLETVEREWVVKSIHDYYAISNAMTLETDFESSSPALEARAIEAGIHTPGAPFAFKSVYEASEQVSSGCHRHARAMELLGARRGQLQITDFFTILRDHREGVPMPGRSPPRICAHARKNPLGQTTASWVASLVPGKTVHWVTGTAAPCTGLFKPVLMETGLPKHGTRPGAAEDNTSLWWRHEQLRRWLEAGDEPTRGAFVAERDALEGHFLAAMYACPPLTCAEVRDEARSIVERCWRDALVFENQWFERAAGRPAAV